jgi:hypothetical protein
MSRKTVKDMNAATSPAMTFLLTGKCHGRNGNRLKAVEKRDFEQAVQKCPDVRRAKAEE